MRAALLLFLAACAVPVEECPLPGTAWVVVPGRRVVITSSTDCLSGYCLQSQPDASVGTCVRPCEPACPAETRCVQVDQDRLCLP